jgi:hypothetical protein
MTFTELEVVLAFGFVVVLFLYFRERDARRSDRRGFTNVLVGLHRKELILKDHGDYIEVVNLKGGE